MSEHVIYGLVDPNTNEIRYIGYTSNSKLEFINSLKNKSVFCSKESLANFIYVLTMLGAEEMNYELSGAKQ